MLKACIRSCPRRPTLGPAVQHGQASFVLLRGLAKITDTEATRPSLRPYQQECIVAIKEALARGVNRIGVSSPTGSGKTVIIAELLQEVRNPSPTKHRVLILVSSIQLALQAAAHVARRHPHLWVEIEQGQKHHAGGHADVTVATWQTLISHMPSTGSVQRKSSSERKVEHVMKQLRLEKFDPAGYKMIIVDEAHHAASRSWRLILNHFDPNIKVDADESGTADQLDGTDPTPSQHHKAQDTQLPSITPPIVGFSATFSRHDGLSLGAVFEEIVFHRDALDMIDEKWLSPLRFTSINAEVPLDSVATSTGAQGTDFTTTSLARVINTEPVNRLIVRTWLARARPLAVEHDTDSALRDQKDGSIAFRSRTLVFAVDIQHVHDLTAAFRAAGVDARSLTGQTSMTERKHLLTTFAEGAFPVLVNCAILTEGADIPSIDCVLLARPTLSRNLFSQMIGRGMRLSAHTGKRDCLILDLVGNCSKGLVCVPTLFGLDPTETVLDMDSQDLLEKRREQREDDGLSQDADAWRRPLLAHGVQDPSKIKMIDWESARALHEAMSAKALFSAGVNGYSGNAWIDCGDEVYVIDIPPSRGFVRVERRDTPGAKEGDEESASRGLMHPQRSLWLAFYTPRNPTTDDPGISRLAGRRRASPYLRPRKILEAETLEQAIRSCDTYIATNILRSSGLMRGLMSRFAPWRAKPASDRQRAFIEKRLGLTTQKHSDRPPIGEGGGVGSSRISSMTKGEASIILTRLNHGAKARWQREARQQNKILERQLRIEQRRQRETVTIGKLAI